TARSAGGVLQRIDHRVGPESLRASTDAPSLVLRAPLALGKSQLLLRSARFPRFRSVEAGVMQADCLARRVAGHAFGAGVPADDLTLAIEHEDRVILHRLHQQP